MTPKIGSKCNFCHYKNDDIQKVKEHEETIHGYFRDAKWRDSYGEPKPFVSKHPGETITLNSFIKTQDDEDFPIYHELKDGVLKTYTDVTKFGERLELDIDKDMKYYIKNFDKLQQQYAEEHNKDENNIS